MSDHEFENYLTLISRFLRLSPAQRDAIGEELRDHFESRLAELLERGVPHEAAVRIAIEEFGDAAGLAANFTSISQTRRKRLIMRCTVASVATIAAAVIVAMAVWPENHAGRVVNNAMAQSNEKPGKNEPESQLSIEELNFRTQQLLNELSAAEFFETPLQEALTYLSDKHKFQIYINKRNLSDAAIDLTSIPVSLNLRNVRLKTLLNWMLVQHQLGYAVRDGVLVIGTKDWLNTELETRVYDCRELIAADNVPMLKPEAKTSNPFNTSTGNSRFQFAQLSVPPRKNKPQNASERLVDLICTTVASPTWDTVGGPGTIVEYQGLLVVSQTAEVQNEVADLLDQLNAKLAAKPEAIPPK